MINCLTNSQLLKMAEINEKNKVIDKKINDNINKKVNFLKKKRPHLTEFELSEYRLELISESKPIKILKEELEFNTHIIECFKCRNKLISMIGEDEVKLILLK